MGGRLLLRAWEGRNHCLWVYHLWDVFCGTFLPIPFFTLRLFSSLSLSPHFLFFLLPFSFLLFFLPSPCLGLSSFHLPISLSSGSTESPQCLFAGSYRLLLCRVSALQGPGTDLISSGSPHPTEDSPRRLRRASLKVKFKGTMFLSSSYLNPSAFPLSPG